MTFLLCFYSRKRNKDKYWRLLFVQSWGPCKGKSASSFSPFSCCRAHHSMLQWMAFGLGFSTSNCWLLAQILICYNYVRGLRVPTATITAASPCLLLVYLICSSEHIHEGVDKENRHLWLLRLRWSQLQQFSSRCKTLSERRASWKNQNEGLDSIPCSPSGKTRQMALLLWHSVSFCW
jgi:hypothetical protein